MAQKKLKQENYVTIADFMVASLERDLADFTAIYKTINKDYLSGFKNAIAQVREFSSTTFSRVEQKQTTQSLYKKADELSHKITLLKSYAKRAKKEVPTLASIYKQLRSRNIEGVTKELREVLPYIQNIATELADMPDDFLSSITPTVAEMEALNTKQNVLINKNKLNTADKKPLYSNLYKYISEVAEAGKIVYNGNTKKDEYIISKILNRT